MPKSLSALACPEAEKFQPLYFVMSKWQGLETILCCKSNDSEEEGPPQAPRGDLALATAWVNAEEVVRFGGRGAPLKSGDLGFSFDCTGHAF